MNLQPESRPLCVIADTREGPSGIPRALSKMGLEVRLKHLAAGDYIYWLHDGRYVVGYEYDGTTGREWQVSQNPDVQTLVEAQVGGGGGETAGEPRQEAPLELQLQPRVA